MFKFLALASLSFSLSCRCYFPHHRHRHPLSHFVCSYCQECIDPPLLCCPLVLLPSPKSSTKLNTQKKIISIANSYQPQISNRLKTPQKRCTSNGISLKQEFVSPSLYSLYYHLWSASMQHRITVAIITNSYHHQ